MKKDWITGSDPLTRRLKTGMWVRWSGSRVEYQITRIGPGGLTVKPSSGKPITISANSELDYRVDNRTPAGISSASQKGRKNMGVSNVPVAERQPNNGGLCLCGCNEIVPGYFKRGHVSSFNGNLRRVARGENTPMRIFGRSIAMRLGPWKNKGKGQVPSKGYKDLR